MTTCHSPLRLTAASFFLRLCLLMVMGEMTICLMRLSELIVIDRFWNYEDERGLTRTVRGTKTMSWHVACQWVSVVSAVNWCVDDDTPFFVIILLSAVMAQSRTFVQSKKIHRNKVIQSVITISQLAKFLQLVITISRLLAEIFVAQFPTNQSALSVVLSLDDAFNATNE